MTIGNGTVKIFGTCNSLLGSVNR